MVRQVRGVAIGGVVRRVRGVASGGVVRQVRGVASGGVVRVEAACVELILYIAVKPSSQYNAIACIGIACHMCVASRP